MTNWRTSSRRRHRRTGPLPVRHPPPNERLPPHPRAVPARSGGSTVHFFLPRLVPPEPSEPLRPGSGRRRGHRRPVVGDVLRRCSTGQCGVLASGARPGDGRTGAGRCDGGAAPGARGRGQRADRRTRRDRHGPDDRPGRRTTPAARVRRRCLHRRRPVRAVPLLAQPRAVIGARVAEEPVRRGFVLRGRRRCAVRGAQGSEHAAATLRSRRARRRHPRTRRGPVRCDPGRRVRTRCRSSARGFPRRRSERRSRSVRCVRGSSPLRS